MNRRGFFSTVLFPFLPELKPATPEFLPVDWKGRVDLEEMHQGLWLVVEGKARSITGWNDNAQVVFADPENFGDWYG